jgi:hypothetical protein
MQINAAGPSSQCFPADEQLGAPDQIRPKLFAFHLQAPTQLGNLLLKQLHRG